VKKSIISKKDHFTGGENGIKFILNIGKKEPLMIYSDYKMNNFISFQHFVGNPGIYFIKIEEKAKAEYSPKKIEEIQSELNVKLEQYGLFRLKISSDGKCFFRSIGHLNNRNDPDVIRKEILEGLKNDEDLQRKFDGRYEIDNKYCSMEEYIQHMSNEFTWGGNMEMIMASKLYTMKFIVFTHNAVQIHSNGEFEFITYDKFKFKDEIPALCFDGQHFDVVTTIEKNGN